VVEILEHLSEDPRIEAAGAGTSLPPSIARLSLTFRWFETERGAEVDKRFDAAPISPGLFRTRGIPILVGRDFSNGDDLRSLPVTILSRAAAQDLFGSEDVAGRQLPIPVLVPDKRAPGVTVVGVVADVHYGGVDAPPAPGLYVPFAQYPFRVVHLFARTRGVPELAAPTMRDAVNAVDRHIAIISTQTLEQSVSDAIAQPRFRTVVFAVLSTIA
jgi:putative ABC transport system permease protein